jgi:beta-fructofuranosidase
MLSFAVSLRAAEPVKEPPSVATEPTKVLRDWESLRYGMFIHFGMSTFVGDQFGRVPSPSTAYAPTDLDEEQWARTAAEAGMKYMVLTVKHHYGHALWPSKVSDYTVTSSSDSRDVAGRFVAACRKHELKPGFYYSLGWDSRHMKKMKPEEYERFVHAQLSELLSNYGPITMLWFDIPWDMGSDMSGALERLYAHCKSLQPDCLILLNQGFVDGSFVEKRLPSYLGKDLSQSPVPIWPKDINNGERTIPRPAGHNPRIAFEGKEYYIPNEVCDSLGQERWFWGPNDGVRPARQMYELYKHSVGRGSNLLLNAGPDKSGRIPVEMVKRLREIASMIAHPETVQDSLLIGRPAKTSNVYRNDSEKWGPQRAVDMDITAEGGTRWATDDNVKSAWLEVDLGGEKCFNRATIAEAFDYIRAFELQVPDGKDGWRAIYQGKRIDAAGAEIALPEVKADKIRLAITDAVVGPTIWDFALYAPRTLVTAGDFVKIYDLGAGEKNERWHINDHSFVFDGERWNVFGIMFSDPATPASEQFLFHATAANLPQQPWDRQPHALAVAKEPPWEEVHLWAPHIIRHDGLYYMFYCAGDKDHSKYKIHLATSKDLKTWQRHPKNPMVVDGFDGRDPFILRHGNEWLMYYTATSAPQGGNHVVACVRSDDLVSWRDKKVVFTDPEKGDFAGPTESPFVVRRGNRYYLFIGPRPDYNGTDVFVSDDPFGWRLEDKVGDIAAHAAEVVRETDGKWYVSRCGWKEGGLYLAPLCWHDGLDEAETNLPVPQKGSEALPK